MYVNRQNISDLSLEELRRNGFLMFFSFAQEGYKRVDHMIFSLHQVTEANPLPCESST